MTIRGSPEGPRPMSKPTRVSVVHPSATSARARTSNEAVGLVGARPGRLAAHRPGRSPRARRRSRGLVVPPGVPGQPHRGRAARLGGDGAAVGRLAGRVARPPGRRAAIAIAAVWLVPLALAPPLFSRDVYSYLAQGTILHLGHNPYQQAPAVLAGLHRAHVLAAVSPFWRHTTAPYGPLFLELMSVIVGITGTPPGRRGAAEPGARAGRRGAAGRPGATPGPGARRRPGAARVAGGRSTR